MVSNQPSLWCLLLQLPPGRDLIGLAAGDGRPLDLCAPFSLAPPPSRKSTDELLRVDPYCLPTFVAGTLGLAGIVYVASRRPCLAPCVSGTA